MILVDNYGGVFVWGVDVIAVVIVESIRTNICALFPLALSKFETITIPQNSYPVLLAIKPTSLIFASRKEFEFTMSIF